MLAERMVLFLLNGEGGTFTPIESKWVLVVAVGLGSSAPLVACGGLESSSNLSSSGAGSATAGSGNSTDASRNVDSAARSDGGAGETGVSSGATGGASGGIGSAHACDRPTPIHVSNGPMTSPEDTGFDMCRGSWVAERRAAKACPLGPTTTDLKQCNGTSCSSDADCAQSPHGFCAESRHLSGYCGCYYGCMQDADCDPGNVCFCGDPVGHCVPSTCVDDSSCGAGKLCASYLAPCIPGQGVSGACTGGVNGCFSGFACQNAADECLYDDDCLPNNARCQLLGDHRVCAPVCPGPPTPTP
jgi:hypothetical protein